MTPHLEPTLALSSAWVTASLGLHPVFGGSLAYWRDAAGAATVLEELLADRLRVLGPDHPRTQATRSSLPESLVRVHACQLASVRLGGR